ncbi:MAG TPA: hypothetical protein VGA37_05005 [Gemmatimonadales bacterium]
MKFRISAAPVAKRVLPDVLRGADGRFNRPDASTSIVSGRHENGASGPSKKPRHASNTAAFPRCTLALAKNTASGATCDAKPSKSRSAMDCAKPLSAAKICCATDLEPITRDQLRVNPRHEYSAPDLMGRAPGYACRSPSRIEFAFTRIEFA